MGNPLLPWVIILGVCAVALAVGLHRSQTRAAILQQELDARDFRRRAIRGRLVPSAPVRTFSGCPYGHPVLGGVPLILRGDGTFGVSEADCLFCRAVAPACFFCGGIVSELEAVGDLEQWGGGHTSRAHGSCRDAQRSFANFDPRSEVVS